MGDLLMNDDRKDCMLVSKDMKNETYSVSSCYDYVTTTFKTLREICIDNGYNDIRGYKISI